jgi:hypothetical protein
MDHIATGGVITLQSRKTKQGIAIRSVIETGSRTTEKTDVLPDKLAGLQEIIQDLDARLLPISTSGQQGMELILSLKTEQIS